MTAWTFHGGRLAAARLRWPVAPEPWLDLSTALNPHPWPIDWHRLPDEEALRDLEAAAAATFRVAAETVCAIPGSEIGLRMMSELDLPRPHRFVAPGYRAHAEAFDDGIAVAPGVIEAIRDGTLLLASPSNPQGLVLPFPAGNVRIVLDEAFADALPEATSELPDDAIRLRSFGKFCGLAGVRLGFVIAPRDELARLRRRLRCWPSVRC